MASDETELRGPDCEAPFNLGIGLPRSRLVMFNAVPLKRRSKKSTIPACSSGRVCTSDKSSVKVNNRSPASRSFYSATGTSEWRHCRELFNPTLPIRLLDSYAAGVSQHLHHGRTDIRERHIASGYRQS